MLNIEISINTENTIKKSVKDRIASFVDDKLICERITRDEVEMLVVNELELTWKFLINNWVYYYFSNINKNNKLYNVDSKDFKRFISLFTELNQKNIYYKCIIKYIDIYINSRYKSEDFIKYCSKI